MKRKFCLPAMLPLMMTGCAMSSPDQPAINPSFKDAGTSCLDSSQVADTIVRDDRTIDFVLLAKSRPVLRNVLVQDCPLLGIEKTFAWESSGNRLCRGNTITVLQNGKPIPGPVCTLGRFHPLPGADR